MNTKALLVGINKYPDPRNSLRGCINDILDMEYFISEKNKVYNKGQINKLTDQHATKKEIVNQLKWLLEGAQAGDQLLFHYSGHGAQAASLHPHMETDGLDEIICPYDYDGSNETMFRDKEFASLFAGIPKGVHFVWISDSCHAEDLSRDPKMENEAVAFRNFIGAKVERSQQHNHSIINPLTITTTPLNGALLSACASDQLSADAIINNRFNGAFTHYLIQNLMEYGATKPMELIVQLVNKDLDTFGYDQDAQSEGLLAKQTFFL